MGQFELTPKNLAVMGIMDEFYDLYCEIKKIYEIHRKLYLRENNDGFPLLSKVWDELCQRDVRKAFEPFLNQFIYLFSSGYPKTYSKAYAFQEFSFVDREKSATKYNSTGPFILSFKSFSEFLIEVQIIMILIDYRYNYNKDTSFTIQKTFSQINNKIAELASREKSLCENDISKIETYTNDTLYIFDRLSSVSCYKHEHPIVSARYVATVAKSGKKISLPVHYCNYCKKYFIGSKTLSLFEKEFGKLIIPQKDIGEMEYRFGCFSAESKLHALGYNVVNGNLNALERKELLIYLIDNQLIYYVELCATIEQNINIFKNSYRHRLAVEKWRIDLKEIGIYILKHPEKKNM